MDHFRYPDFERVQSVVVLTGAGISAESGVATFRDGNGLWNNHRIEDVATPEGFARNPALVQAFYNQRRAQLSSVGPNAAHDALARLAEQFSGDFLLVTQNVDDLHDRALAAYALSDRFRFHHMHGELTKVRCVQSGIIYAWSGAITQESLCGCCLEAGTLRPHIVWFGEMPFYMPEIYRALAECDLFVSIGTSGNVYPAAGFAAEAKACGAYTLELNLEPSQGMRLFDEAHQGRASELVPAFVEAMLARGSGV